MSGTWTMETRRGAIRCLLLPLAGCRLLLPSVAVAEVLPAARVEPVAEAPQWLVGMVEWRFVSIPLLSFEVVSGHPPPQPGTCYRVAVLHTTSGDADFYGLLMQGIPNLVQVRESELTLLPATSEAYGVAARVEVRGQLALIPEPGFLEQMLSDLPFGR